MGLLKHKLPWAKRAAIINTECHSSRTAEGVMKHAAKMKKKQTSASEIESFAGAAATNSKNEKDRNDFDEDTIVFDEDMKDFDDFMEGMKSMPVSEIESFAGAAATNSNG